MAAESKRITLAIDLLMSMARLRARIRKEAGPPADGWTLPQVTVLKRIIDNGPTTTSQLAASEHVQPQSMAVTVHDLRRAGLVASDADPTDGRRRLLTATEAGRQLHWSVRRSRGAWLADAMDQALGEDERAILERAAKIIERLAEVPAP